MGDVNESMYVASYELATIYNGAPVKSFVVQAVDDLATDEIISQNEITISSGVRVYY